jgi:hypothetical protein
MSKKNEQPQVPRENSQNREELPGGAKNFVNKEPPPHTRNAPQTQHAERSTPRSKR